MVDEDFAWRLAQDLVKIDSSDPGAYEGEIERHIKDLVEAYVAKLDSPMLDAAEVYGLEVLPGHRNLMITVPPMTWRTRTRPSASLPATPTPPSLPARQVTAIA